MSGSPHRRQANTRPRSYRMAGPPQQAPRQSRLAIHNRQRPRQAEETVPSVRVTRATSLPYVGFEEPGCDKESSMRISGIEVYPAESLNHFQVRLVDAGFTFFKFDLGQSDDN